MMTCILLAAGLSQRFGSPKALAKLNGKTIITYLQKMLVRTQVGEIIVVLGAHADRIKPHLLNHKKVKFVYNKDYNFGQTSSFKAGLQCVSDHTQGVMLLPVDYPLIQEATIDGIIQYFLDNDSLIVVPAYADKNGHPPLFSVSLRDDFLDLNNESGLNAVARAHQAQTATFSVEDTGVIRTFNTQEEFLEIKKDFRNTTSA